jgi:tetratricopeptide (TPR) repeat protein
MVSAPFVALLYDRTFLAGSWRAIPVARRRVHGALLATLALVPLLLAAAPMDWRYSSGAGAEGISALAYARTQPEVILRYLRLAVWPNGLTLDYSWPAATSAVSLVLAALAGVAVLVALALAFRGSAIAFLVASFFLILAPTSSFVPLLDVAFEHRMHLALAVVVLLAVLGGWELIRRAATALAWPPGLVRRVAAGSVAVVALALGAVTVQRNNDYRSAVAIWTDTAAKRPDNLRARVNLAYAVGEAQGFERALAETEAIVQRDPDYPWAHLASGYFLLKLGRLDAALPRLSRAAQRLPASAEAHYLLGSALSERGAIDEAIAELEQAVRLEPWRAEAENNLGAAHSRRGAWDAAITHYRRALALDPRYVNARFNLAMAYANLGDVERTRVALLETLAIAPDHARARAALAEIEAGAGR